MVIKRVRNQKALGEVSGTPCVICGKPSDAAHIKSKGAGGDDVPDNLYAACRYHHYCQHQLGFARMVELYPKLGDVLKEKGWHVVLEFGVNRLRRI
jgi:hypothetical protein